MSLLSQNKKMKKSTSDSYSVFNFGLPAYRSSTGLITCPAAGACKTGCYATQGAYVWSNVAAAFEARLQATLSGDFADLMIAEIAIKLKTAIRQQKQLVIRIHDSGDFYSPEYLRKWDYIIEQFPTVKFYAYTKQVKLFRNYKKPDNFMLIFSEGGIFDGLIDQTRDRHSRVFGSREELLAAGYADASEDDMVAALGDSHKIGLIYHGAKSKSWTTDKKAS